MPHWGVNKERRYKLTALLRGCAGISNMTVADSEVQELLHGTELQWRKKTKELFPLEIQAHTPSGYCQCR